MCRRIALLGLALLALGGCEHATPLPGDQPVRVPDRTVGTSPLEPAMVRERCTTTWVGPRRGEWHLARHWSARREPTALDEACVPRGRTVLISHGTAHVGALVAGGDLVMTGGTLELASLETASEVFNLRIGGRAALYGGGNLIVIGSERGGGGKGGGGRGARAPPPPPRGAPP